MSSEGCQKAREVNDGGTGVNKRRKKQGKQEGRMATIKQHGRGCWVSEYTKA